MTLGATSNASCAACSLGQFSGYWGATSFTTCRLCAAGSFADSIGAAACTLCPPGTANGLVGSTTEADCLPCDPGYFANVSGQSMCVACFPGSFQKASGASLCEPCQPGSFAASSATTSCLQCTAGFFASSEGMDHCLPCPSGTLQLEPGGTTCLACPTDYMNLPAPISTTHETDVCSSFQRAAIVNWGPVENPALLAANVTVDPESIPAWLSVRVTGGAIISVSSSMIPPAAAVLGGGVVNLTVFVSHTCRTQPSQGVISLQLFRADPVMVRDPSFGPSVLACPDFSLQYMALLGTCAAQTVVLATLANGSALPSFVVYAFSNNILEIAGTAPPGMEPLDVVAVAQLGKQSFRSAVTKVSLAPMNILRIATPVATIRACPYVSIVFSISRTSSCGQLHAWATLANGSALPSFLSTAMSDAGTAGGSTTTFTVLGTVPEHYPDLSVLASASTGGQSFNSTAVLITRPQITSTANVTIMSGNVSASSSQRSTPQQFAAFYGVLLNIAASVDSGTEQVCSSVGLVVSSYPPDERSPSLELPAWIAVSTVSLTSIFISANPTSDVAPMSSITLYVWANDGLRNPGFILTIVTEQSLRIASSSSSHNSSLLPEIITPTSLLQMQLDVVGADDAMKPVLICPTAAAAAFCSLGSDAASIGAFGTPAGVNTVLRELSVSMPQGLDITSNMSVLLSFKESVNPGTLVVHIPLSALRKYTGVTQIRALHFEGKVGKPLAEPLASFFNETGLASVSYAVFSNTTWLTIQGGVIGGLLPSPPAVVDFIVVASDKYTRYVANGTVNVSWPMSPTVNLPSLSHWYVTSSTQLDVQLPTDLIVDPENGTIVFDLLQYTGSDTLQPLPLFLTFDANNLRMSGTPQAADVGMYALLLVGTSQWGPWKGNATVLLTITVEQSWADFFAWVYSIVGYCASALGVVTWCLVYRALLTNMVMFSKRMKASAPAQLCLSGRYTLQLPRNSDEAAAEEMKLGRPLLVTAVKAIRVAWMKKAAQSPGPFTSTYLALRNRLEKLKPKADLLNGPPWMLLDVKRDETIELVVDVPSLQHLVAVGRVMVEDEYYVEVISTGRWKSGTIIEAFTFFVRDVIGGAPDATAEESSSLEKVLGRLRAVETRLLETEATVAERWRDDLKSKNDNTSSAEDSRMGGHRIDPYTGKAILLFPESSDETSDSEEILLNDDDDEDDDDDEEENDEEMQPCLMHVEL